MLTEREKFIAHYLSVAIVAAINNQSSSAADRTIDKLRETRTRSITFEEGQKIMIIAPIVRGKKGEHLAVYEDLRQEGFVRAKVNEKIYFV